MTGLEQVKTAVVSALSAAGVTALGAYPDGGAPQYAGAVAVVGVEGAESPALGFCDYLGRERDAESGETVERYARRLNAVLSLDIYAAKAAGAAATENAMERCGEALMTALPAGLRLTALRWDRAAWDAGTGMFLRRGTAACQALFLASAPEGESGMILDFILKGVMSD